MNVNRRRGSRLFSDSKWVYIAGTYRGKSSDDMDRFHETCNNVAAARERALLVARLGAYPITPHLLTGLFDFEQGLSDVELARSGRDGHRFWLDNCLDLLLVCDCVLVLPDSENSSGTQKELEIAKARGVPVFYTEQSLTDFIIGEDVSY